MEITETLLEERSYESCWVFGHGGAVHTVWVWEREAVVCEGEIEDCVGVQCRSNGEVMIEKV